MKLPVFHKYFSANLLIYTIFIVLVYSLFTFLFAILIEAFKIDFGRLFYGYVSDLVFGSGYLTYRFFVRKLLYANILIIFIELILRKFRIINKYAILSVSKKRGMIIFLGALLILFLMWSFYWLILYIPNPKIYD